MPGLQDEYVALVDRMQQIAKTIPGYISHKGFWADDGERVTIVEFEHEEGQRAWRMHPEHLEAQKLGRVEVLRDVRHQGLRQVTYDHHYERKMEAADRGLTGAHRDAIQRLRRTPNMDKFDKLEGVAAPLRIVNVDTDMIIPKQYLKTLKRTGLAKGLFSELRYMDDGSENPDFVLNKPAYRKAKILVADNNFGCGSSREHAPWALMDYGIRCVISTQFGDIFYNNCFKNGVLPIKVSPEDLEKLFDDAERGANATLSIDLEKQEIRGPDGGVVKFDIDPHRKHCMLNGLDDIGLTKLKQTKIDSFEEKSKAARPWA